jgi:hypothetical protein
MNICFPGLSSHILLFLIIFKITTTYCNNIQYRPLDVYYHNPSILTNNNYAIWQCYSILVKMFIDPIGILIGSLMRHQYITEICRWFQF